MLPTSRSRAPIQGDEEAAAELRLGEFQDVDALTHSEAALVITAVMASRRKNKEGKVLGETEYVAFFPFTSILGHCLESFELRKCHPYRLSDVRDSQANNILPSACY